MQYYCKQNDLLLFVNEGVDEQTGREAFTVRYSDSAGYSNKNIHDLQLLFGTKAEAENALVKFAKRKNKDKKFSYKKVDKSLPVPGASAN